MRSIHEEKKLSRAYVYDFYDALFVLILIMASLYQLSIMGIHRMHMDETLYSYWALKIADGRDLFLHHTYSDKFPLLSYIIAFFVKVFGNNEVTVRLPSFLCTTAGFIVFYRASSLFYGKKTAVLAVFITAMTKYYLVFGPTAFTDQIMTFFVLLSFLAFVKKEYFRSGIFIGISAMAKLTGLYFALPFGIGIMLMDENYKKSLTDFGKGIGIIFAVILLWAGLVQLHAFKLFMANSPIPYKGIIDFGFFLQGLNIIKNLQSELMGAGKFIAAVISAVLLLGAGGNKEKKKDWVIVLAVILFYLVLAAMTFRQVPIFDRYLVAIVPFAALLAARGIVYLYGIIREKNEWAGIAAAFVLTAAVIMPFDRDMKIGALYDVNDGLKTAVDSIYEKEKAVAVNMGIHHAVALYYYDDFAHQVGHISGIKTEIPRAKEYIAKDEGRRKYIIATPKGAAAAEEEIEIVEGIYYDHGIKLYDTVYINGNPKYYVYEVIYLSKLKKEFLAQKEDAVEPQITADVLFDNAIRLRGYDMEKMDENHIKFTFYWEKTGKTENDSKIGVGFYKGKKHIRDGDHFPAHGLAMFGSIGINDIVIDTHIVEFDRWGEVDGMRINLHNERTSKKTAARGGALMSFPGDVF